MREDALRANLTEDRPRTEVRNARRPARGQVSPLHPLGKDAVAPAQIVDHLAGRPDETARQPALLLRVERQLERRIRDHQMIDAARKNGRSRPARQRHGQGSSPTPCPLLGRRLPNAGAGPQDLLRTGGNAVDGNLQISDLADLLWHDDLHQSRLRQIPDLIGGRCPPLRQCKIGKSGNSRENKKDDCV